MEEKRRFNKKAYDTQFQKENYKQVKFAFTLEEYSVFNEYVKALGMSKAAYIEGLIDADRIARGLEPIFKRK